MTPTIYSKQHTKTTLDGLHCYCLDCLKHNDIIECNNSKCSCCTELKM